MVGLFHGQGSDSSLTNLGSSRNGNGSHGSPRVAATGRQYHHQRQQEQQQRMGSLDHSSGGAGGGGGGGDQDLEGDTEEDYEMDGPQNGERGEGRGRGRQHQQQQQQSEEAEEVMPLRARPRKMGPERAPSMMPGMKGLFMRSGECVNNVNYLCASVLWRTHVVAAFAG